MIEIVEYTAPTSTDWKGRVTPGRTSEKIHITGTVTALRALTDTRPDGTHYGDWEIVLDDGDTVYANPSWTHDKTIGTYSLAVGTSVNALMTQGPNDRILSDGIVRVCSLSPSAPSQEQIDLYLSLQ